MKIASIIIPVLNAEKYIGQCLSALQNLDFPKDQYEIIVVDNGSTDKTSEIIKKYPVEMHVLPKVTISCLRNYGASKAKGNILAFIDVDCIAPDSWLKKSVKMLKNEQLGVLGSWYRLPENATFLERVWDTHMSCRRSIVGDIDWIPSGNLIIPKSVYNKINGFNEFLTTSEDVDICQRIRSAGFFVFSNPDLAVIHLGESKDLKHFFLKEKWRGEGVIQNILRELPNIRFNKVIIFTGVTFISILGILISIVVRNYSFSGLFLILLFLIPLYLAIKSCVSSKKSKYFIPLMFLFIVYAFARICSAFNPKVWKK